MPGELSSDERIRLRQLEDRSAIEDVVNRYGQGIRQNDAALISSCFTDEATIDQGHGRYLRGHDAILTFYSDKASNAASPTNTFSKWVISTPFISNILISLDGDTAHCESMCLTVHAGYKDQSGTIIMRGAENIDELIRTHEGWKIQHRHHPVWWDFEVQGRPLDASSQEEGISLAEAGSISSREDVPKP